MTSTTKDTPSDFEKMVDSHQKLALFASVSFSTFTLLGSLVSCVQENDRAAALNENIHNSSVVLFVDGKALPNDDQATLKELAPVLIAKGRDTITIELKAKNGDKALAAPPAVKTRSTGCKENQLKLAN